MKIARYLLAAFMAGAVVAPATMQDAAPTTRTAILCGKLYTGKGQVFAPGLLIIDQGRVVSVAQGDVAPAGATVIDLRPAVVIPGLVNACASLVDPRDSIETVTPEIRAIDGFERFRDVAKALEGGVTTLHITPGSNRLVSGQGAIVKSGGEVGARVLRASYGLKVFMGERPKNPPAVFEPPIPPSTDNPILPPKRQYPMTRMGELAKLRQVLAEAQHKRGNPHPESTTRANFLDPLREVVAGERPLIVQAGKADDIVKAVLLAEEFKLGIMIAGAQEADRIAPFLAEHKVPVAWDAGVTAMGGRRSKALAFEGTPALSGAAALEKAGVAFALQSPSDGEMPHLLLQAAWAVRAGVSPEKALRAVTGAAAEMIGVGDRVGALEKDFDADFAVLSGDPFSPATRVEKVFIGGALVHERRAVDIEQKIAEFRRLSYLEGLTVVRAGRILSGVSGPTENGVIFIEGAKITYVGRETTIPPGAKVIDATKMTVVPGFVNLGGWIGLSPRVSESSMLARRSPVDAPQANLDFTVAAALAADDPAYREALASGVTLVLVSPSGQGVCTLVKLTGGAPRVVREVAAIRFEVGPGKGAYNQLKKRLEAAKKYHEEWEAFEKQPKDAAKEAPKAPAASGPKEDPISGTWEGTVSVPSFGVTERFVASMKLDGSTVNGTVSSPRDPAQSLPFTGTWASNELTVNVDEQGATGKVTLKLEGPDTLKGDFKITYQGMTIEGNADARRTVKDGGAPAAAAAPGEKKELKKDDRLEAYRPLFRREIPALVRASTIPAIENALKIFRDDFNLNFTLLDPTDAYGDPNGVLGRADGVAWSGAFLGEHRNEPINSADLFMRRRLPVAFFAPGEGETPMLPMLAGAALHYGCDAAETLRALTSGPAKLLLLEKQVGSLTFGRDADLLICSGDPFDWTCRVETVLVDGKIVYERK